MGQYHYTVNLDKREFLHPHQLGDGLKLVEQSGWSAGGTNDALHLLLAVSNGRGGGDFDVQTERAEEWIGRWGGDRIAVVGDYAEDGDLPGFPNAAAIYAACQETADEETEGPLPPFRNITGAIVPILEEAYEIVYFGDGWRERAALDDLIEGWQYSHRLDKRVANISGKTYPLDTLLVALRSHLAATGRRKRGAPKIAVSDLGVAPLDNQP